jgi:thiamine biosynthesis lipoprotein
MTNFRKTTPVPFIFNLPSNLMRRRRQSKSVAFQALFLSACLMMSTLTLSSCQSRYEAYSYEFTGTFDTVISLVGHMASKKEFDSFSTYAEKRLTELHQLYDIYHDYDGMKNIKTINDNAGIAPVVVSDEVYNLLSFSKDWYTKTNGKVNIALGSVLKIWHDYRSQADMESDNNPIPTMQELMTANEHVSIDSLVLDSKAKTAYVNDAKVQLDVGAVAKGYATELVCNELSAKGYKSFAISAGGNVKVVGKPLAKNRSTWTIGIQNPDPNINPDPNVGLVAKVSVEDTSVVTSGWYQRYFVSGGKIYHHIIDPVTLFPQNYYKAITIVYPDSGISDVFSTAIMLMPYEEAVQFLKQYPGVNVYFILFDGTVKTTEGMDQLLIHSSSTSSTSSSIIQSTPSR